VRRGRQRSRDGPKLLRHFSYKQIEKRISKCSNIECSSYRRYDTLISAPCAICPWIHIHVMSVTGVLSTARVTLEVGHIVKQRIVGGAQQFGEYHGRGSSGAAGLDGKRAWFGWIGSASVEGDAQLHPIGARVGGLGYGFDQIGGDCTQA